MECRNSSPLTPGGGGLDLLLSRTGEKAKDKTTLKQTQNLIFWKGADIA